MNEFIARRGIISLDGAQITGSLSATGNISSNTLTVTNGITGTATSASYVEYSNVAGKPALVSGSSQIFAGYDYEIHVSQVDGNDTTGNGDLLTPVASITKALTLTTSSRKTIIVHPGTYSENITVGTTNTTISTSELTGANTLLSGTLTIGTSGSGTRISGLKMTNLVISGTAQAYISNCTIDDQVTKSSSGYVEIINSEMQCTSGIQISGAGTTIINGNKNVGIAVSNASAQVIIKGCNSVVTPSASAGNLAIVDCIVTALGGNGITITGASTTLTLLNSQVLVQAGNNVAPISVAGIYSIINTIYDKPGSTLTGTSTNSVDYFQYINADNITSTNGLTVTGSLTVTGQVVAQTLNVQQVTSSIVYSSGSNIFGNSLANTQQFTGSMSVTGSLTVVTAGTELQVTSTGVNLGNALTDSHIISGSLRVNPNGLFVSGSGNVGIGTNTPSEKLDVVGGGLASGNGTIKTGITYSSLGLVGTFSNHDLGIITNGTERMRITSGGNVGIGTSLPAVALDFGNVTGKAFHLYTAGSDFYGINMLQYDDGPFSTNIFSGDGGQIKFRTASGTTTQSTRMTITSGGNVGIGTTSPGQRLVVENSTDTFLQLRNSAAGQNFFIGALNGEARLNNDNSTPITMYVNGSERMRITSGGNVGIGTTSPLQTASNRTVTTINGTSSAILNLATGDTLRGYVYVDSSGTTLESIGTLSIGTNTSSALVAYTNGTERLRITSEGYLGVTVTGDTVTSGDLLGVLSFVSRDASTYSSGGITNIRSYATSTYNTGNVAGDLRFYVSDGLQNTTGTYLFGTEAMRITSGGNVGIGTTNPGQKLEVVGGEIKAGRVDTSSEGGQVSFGRASDNNTAWYIDVFGSTSSPALRFVNVSDSAVVMTMSGSNVTIGDTSTDNTGRFQYLSPGVGSFNGVMALYHSTTNVDGSGYVNFYRNTSVIGSINQVGTSGIAYNTSSDYRLKKDIQPITDALVKIQALNPVKYKWKSDNSDGEGFIAHELQEIIPYVVTGEKDGERMQGVDYGKLTILLTKAIQEQQSQIESLKAEIQTLKQ